MSFANVQATRNGDALTLSRGELSLTLEVARFPNVPPEVIVGVRPEHAHLWRDGAGLLGPIVGQTDFVELLGRETLIGVVTAGELHFTVLAEPDATTKPGEQVRFGLEPGHLHLFDSKTERALATV